MRKIIRANDRNKSWIVYNANGQKTYLKESLEKTPYPAKYEEFSWRFFSRLNPRFFPKLIKGYETGQIEYEYIENHHPLAWKSFYFLANLKNLSYILYRNNKANTVVDLNLDHALKKYYEYNKQKWIKRFDGVLEGVDKIAVYSNLLAIKKVFLSSEVVLCHGDLGLSNILCDQQNVVLIDYEYSLLSTLEFDICRLIAKLFLHALNDNDPSYFSLCLDSILSYIKNDLDYFKLLNYVGFHLLDYWYCHVHYNNLVKINDKDILIPIAENLLLAKCKTDLFGINNLFWGEKI